jgi:hypothetical protein
MSINFINEQHISLINPCNAQVTVVTVSIILNYISVFIVGTDHSSKEKLRREKTSTTPNKNTERWR